MKLIKTLSLLSVIMIIIDYIFALYLVPQFKDIHQSFNSSTLPLITQFIIVSHQYWIILITIPIGIYWKVFIEYKAQNTIKKKYEGVTLSILIFLLIILLLIFPLTIWAMYLPIFELA